MHLCGLVGGGVCLHLFDEATMTAKCGKKITSTVALEARIVTCHRCQRPAR
jgi:hypothetical protein